MQTKRNADLVEFSNAPMAPSKEGQNTALLQSLTSSISLNFVLPNANKNIERKTKLERLVCIYLDI